MSLPACPECGQSIPMSENVSTSVKRPLSRTCSACEADLPNHLFAHTEDDEPSRPDTNQRWLRRIRG